MVEATNYAYLAILICLQYLGLQHESYEVTINFSKVESFEKQAPASLILSKFEDQENEWIITSKDIKQKISMSVVKDSVTVFDQRIKAVSTNFDNIDFDRFTKQQDTIFTKKQEAVAVITKNNKTIVFKMLDNTVYEQITMTAN